MLDYHRRNKESVAFEGTEFSPEWVSKLAVQDFNIKAAYVGYTDASHIDFILAHAKDNGHDWINDWLENDRGDETNIRGWAVKQAEKCKQLKKEAELHGYPFLDISTQPFADYKSFVLSYFARFTTRINLSDLFP
jgi:hypothetical protein